MSSVFGEYAKISSYINMLNPLPLFMNSLTTKNYGSLSPIRYSAITLMQLLWVLYGIQTKNNNIVKACSASMSLFFIFSITGFFLLKQFRELSLLVLTSVLFYFCFKDIPTDLLGILCCLVNIAAAMTPIEIILKAIKERNVAVLNSVSIYLNLPATFLWCSYGLETKDYFIFIPNFIEMILVYSQALLLPILKNMNPKVQKQQDQEHEKHIKQQDAEVDQL